LKRLRELLAINRPALAQRRALPAPGRSATLASLPPTLVEWSVKVCFPEDCRPRTLIVVSDPSPFYLDQLAPDEKADYFDLAALTVEVLERGGVRALEVGRDYPVAHYFDTIHLSAAGGRQMADSVAPRVREMARQLGYANGPRK
jgi:hypothetical protein